MYLYRVEHKTERAGPYHTIGPELKDDKPHLYTYSTHPSPYDEDLNFDYGMHCGFESKQKLLDWFTFDDLKDFQKYGMNVYKIHVDDGWVEKGVRQLIFDPAYIYDRKKISLKDLRRWKQRCICSFQPNGATEEWKNSVKLVQQSMNSDSIHGFNTMLQ